MLNVLFDNPAVCSSTAVSIITEEHGPHATFCLDTASYTG